MSSRPPVALMPPLPALPDGARVLVGYSGGLDSTVLLHALAAAGAPGLTAVHVHHGLQAAADDWARHAATVCAALAVPLIACRARIAADAAAGPEGAAREARYALLRAQMRPGDLLVTAHHRDDQVETVLLRLIRGVGVHGLAAMRPLTTFAPGQLWRPLLDQPRAALRDYAERHALTWVDDPHNDDPRYARSWLRQQFLPGLRARFPQTDDSLARTARLAGEATDLLDELAAADHAATACGMALSVSALLALSPARRHNLIRWWLARQQFRAPFAVTLDRIDRELLAAGSDAEPLIHWPGCELRRHRDRLLAMAPLAAEPPPGDWGLWQSRAAPALPTGCGALFSDHAPPQPLRIRSLMPGEAIRLAGHPHRKRCRNLFQECGIPRWARSRLPVLEADAEAFCIAGVGATDGWQQWLAAAGWRGHWRPGLAGLPDSIALTAAPLGRDCP
ncbi:MAG: tRNA lysidine(34) synthetase TilS [Xanthomonadaceae bacterium]|nr:tRNA lysidine(34) synthetase TilS [Xanthomonadaceae bacterium]